MLRVVGYIFAACAFLSVAETAIDAFVHQPMAEFLVKRFADLMLVCVSTIGGLLAGQKIESGKKLRDQANEAPLTMRIDQRVLGNEYERASATVHTKSKC